MRCASLSTFINDIISSFNIFLEVLLTNKIVGFGKKKLKWHGRTSKGSWTNDKWSLVCHVIEEVIEPYVFENNYGGLSWREVDGMNRSYKWLYQDLLLINCPGSVIRRFVDQHWLSRSCNLTAIDYCHWWVLKESRVYVNDSLTV